MLKGAIAQRNGQARRAEVGVRTGHVHKGNHKQPSVRRVDADAQRKFRQVEMETAKMKETSVYYRWMCLWAPRQYFRR